MKIIKYFFNMPERRFLIIISLLILALRAGYILTLEDKWYYYDTVHYDTAAQHIVKGEGFGPSLYFGNLYAHYCLEPLYPLFLAGIYGIFGHSLLAARLLQAVLGFLSLLLLYSLARQVIPPKTARWVLIAGAFYPFFIYIPGLLYITQLFSFFIVLSVWLFMRYIERPSMKWLILGGIVLGLAVLARPVYLIAVPLVVIWLLLFVPQSWRKRLTAVMVLGLTLVAVFTPWTVRNYILFEKPKFARACLPQGDIYGGTFWNIQRAKTFEKSTVDIETFSVSYHELNERSYFEFFINDEYFFTLNPHKKLTIPDSASYFGILFAGRFENRVDYIAASRIEKPGTIPTQYSADTRDSLNVSYGSPEIDYTTHGISFTGAGNDWDFPLLFADKTDANFFRIGYASGIRHAQLRRVALLIFLDKPQPDASGYMVWLHPWKEPDLWTYSNGKPDNSIPVLKTFVGQEHTSLFYLLRTYPVEFIFGHFIPEFIKFWSPRIIRVESEGGGPGALMQAVAITSFTPLLLLLPFGIWALRKRWRLLALYLVPVITLSGGYSLYFSQTRYRIPVDQFLVLFAVLGAFWIYSGLKRKKTGNIDV